MTRPRDAGSGPASASAGAWPRARLAAAALLGATAPAVVAAMIYGLTRIAVTGSAHQDGLMNWLRGLIHITYVGLAYGLIFGLPAMILAGLPWHAIMLRRGATRWPSYLLGGALGGFALTLALALVLGVRASFIILVLTFSACILAGGVFWRVRRPDKMERN